MKAAAFAFPLLLVAAAPPSSSHATANLALLGDVERLGWEEGCCGGFRHGLPPALHWRLRKAQKRLAACYGEAAVDAQIETARNAFDEQMGYFDPVARRPTFEELLAEQQDAYTRYSAQLSELERALKRGC